MLALGVSNLGLSSSQKRAGLTIGQLLPAGLNRVAAIYTDPARPGYDECIQQNRKALGPELVVNGDFSNGVANWTPTNSATLVSTANVLKITANSGAYPSATQDIACVVGSTYLLMARLEKGTSTSQVGVVIQTLMSVNVSTPFKTNTSDYAVVLFRATQANHRVTLYHDNVSPTGEASFSRVSVREITDWSQCVLFDDANGNVPIFSVLQSARGRGLLLDRSQGLVRGPELIANGKFDVNMSGWVLGSDPAQTIPTLVDGAVVLTRGAGGSLGFNTSAIPGVVANRFYELTFKVLAGGSCACRFGNVNHITNPAGRTIRKIVQITTETGISFWPEQPGSSCTIDDISVRELFGNHMSQPTAAARGEFSAKYNLLASSVGNLAVAPWASQATSGTVQADGSVLLKRNSTVAAGYVTLGGGMPVTQHHTVSVEVKKGTVGSLYGVRLQGSYPDRCDAVLDMDTGVLAVSGGTNFTEISGEVVSLSDGWFRVTLRGKANNGSASTCALVHGPAKTASLTGWEAADAQLLEAYARKPDLRLTADVIPSIPAYQRVTSTTDYDTEGFPVKHRGVTDDTAFADINPNGATGVLLLTAVQKMTDSAPVMLIESSPTTDSNNGTFFLMAPRDGGSPNAGFRSKGTVLADVRGVGIPAFSRAVIGGFGDIANDIARIFINGVATTVTTDQGAGTYTPQRVYFGSRGNASLFENTNHFAPPLMLFTQPGDMLPVSHFVRLQKAYAKAAGVML
jgi:hypothetical protein